MKPLSLFIILLSVVFLTVSCWQYPPPTAVDDENPVENGEDPNDDDEIPDTFDFSLVRHTNLMVDVSHTNGSPYAGAVLELFQENVCGSANKDDHRIMRFRLDDQGSFRSIISIPMGLDNLYLCPLSDGFPQSLQIPIDKDANEARIQYANAGTGNPGEIFDEYPGDSWRQYNNYYPTKTSTATLMFEDSWPRFDDFDMNDLVLDYRMTEVTNNNNEVVELHFELFFRATCAGFVNAFGIELPVPSSNVNDVSGTHLPQGLINLLGNGLEAGHPNRSVVIVTDNITDHIDPFINCFTGQAGVPPGELQVTVTFINPVDKVDLGVAPYKPFIIAIAPQDNISVSRGMEIHLPNKAPTALANTSMFGTEDDTSNPAIGRYYLGTGNRNWGMLIPESLDVYPTTNSAIDEAFTRFLDWAESGGKEYYDWYLDLPGYRNNALLFRN